MKTDTIPGTLYGIGVGPGDPELITLKAHRLINTAGTLAYIVNADGYSLAKDIARESLPQIGSQRLLPIYVEMQPGRRQANRAYEEAARAIRRELAAGQSVAFLCEGDPLFYGSFSYLLERIGSDYPCVAVPGISSMHAASAAVLQPLALLQENLAVISARSTDEALLDALQRFDNLVILKGGRRRDQIRDLIVRSGRGADAQYLEHLTRAQERQVREIQDLPATPGPYFSLFLVNRKRAS